MLLYDLNPPLKNVIKFLEQAPQLLFTLWVYRGCLRNGPATRHTRLFHPSHRSTPRKEKKKKENVQT